MSKVQIQTENLSVKEINNLSSEEKEKQGEIYRVCYLKDGENIIVLDEKDPESLQRHTRGKADNSGKLHYYFSVKCVDPCGNSFRLFLSSFDAVAFTAPYGVVKEKHYSGKVKAVRLTDKQVGDANTAYRACTTQAEMLKELLKHTKKGKCKISVKVISIGAESPNSDKTQVAVERNWDNSDNKEYIFKGVKHLYSISFVD